MFRKFTLLFSGILLFSLISWQCTKIDTTDIGGNLIPAVDNVTTFATEVAVISNNIDSLSTNPMGIGECAIIDRTDENLLGYIGNNSPAGDVYFGKTTASIYFQILPQFVKFSYPVRKDSLFLDSAVLVLSYKRTYGDTSSMQTVNVHQVNGTNASFKADSFYTSCNTFTGTGPLLGTKNYLPKNLTDSQRLFRERAKNQLRIRLDQPGGSTFARALLDQDTTTGFRSDSAFKAFFRGFAITPGTSGNSVSYFNLTDTNTKVALYYRYTKRTTGVDTAVTYFRLANTGATANKIVRDHSGAEIQAHLNPAVQDSVIYLQTTPGTYALLKIPGLRTLGNRIIHRAELIIDQVYSTNLSDTYFTPPEYLFLDVKDTAVNSFKAVPCDFNTFSGSPNLGSFGGFRTIVKDPFGNTITRYVFNISRYTQQAVTKGKLDYTFRLSAPYNIFLNGYPSGYVDECGQFVGPYNYGMNQVGNGRIKVGGGNSTHYKMKVRIIYSNI